MPRIVIPARAAGVESSRPGNSLARLSMCGECRHVSQRVATYHRGSPWITEGRHGSPRNTREQKTINTSNTSNASVYGPQQW